MRVADLQKVLIQADGAAVLVSAQIMERVIREGCNLPSLYIAPPHRKTFVADRQTLYDHAAPVELELEPDLILPDTVILLVRPENEELSALEEPNLLLKYWRRLFHARVHLALGDYDREGPHPLHDTRIEERIEEIGRTAFEEARAILIEDGYLPFAPSDRATYIEFAAVFLEMRYFASTRLPNFFPGIRDLERVAGILARDLDTLALLRATRLRGAPDPVARIEKRTADSEEAYWQLVRSAQRAAARGNTVRAAIQNLRAARIAPAAKSISTREEAEKNLRELTARLAAALTLEDTEAGAWFCYLAQLLDKADQGSRPAEALLLEDLQTVCLDSEQVISTLDVGEWILSGFRRPVKRPLPSQRTVRIVKHLRSAVNRIPAVRLADPDRDAFHQLLRAALTRAETNVRARFRPVLVAAFEDAGLEPTNPPEQTAFKKVIEELLDRILALGFFTFADLRDTLSRNQLKLHDLRDAQDLLRGDALIRLNGRLAALLDGVYRPGEVYVRLLEWLTALKFGTPVGRFLTRTVTIPFGGVYLLMHGLGFLLVGLLWLLVRQGYSHEGTIDFLHALTDVLLGPWHRGGAEVEGEAVRESSSPVWHYLLWGAGSLFLLGLIRWPRFRRRCQVLLNTVGHSLRGLFWDLPRHYLPLQGMQRFLNSSLFQLLLWFVLQPLAVCSVLGCFWPTLFVSVWTAVPVFLLVFAALNSRGARMLGQALWQGTLWLSHALQAGLLRGLIHLILQVFKRINDLLEWVLFSVEEWLRFRTGDSTLSLVVRSVLGLVWFPFAYVARCYVVVLIEPGLNPIKAPFSILAGKFMVPILPGLTSNLAGFLGSFTWPVLGNAIAYPTGFLLPDAFGFLFWEIKENWSLYRANRSANLRAVSVGPHGEKVRGLLQPGFHSGTVPRLFRHLRQAERKAYRTNDWQPARACRRELEEIAHALERFVARELVGLLRQSHSWQTQAEPGAGGVCALGSPRTGELEVGPVLLATNQIQVSLLSAAHPTTPVVIEVERRGGRWLVATLREHGWLVHLGPEALRAFTAALAGWYKLAGIQLVHEQIRANLPARVTGFEVVPEGLQVRVEGQAGTAIYDLTDPIEPLVPTGEAAGVLPTLDPCHLLFSQAPVSWEEWVACWLKDQAGKGHPGIPGLGEQLVRLPVVAPPAGSTPVAPAGQAFGPTDQNQEIPA